MAKGKLYVDIKCKYPRLLYWINVPLYMLGCDPFAPDWMFEMSEVHGEYTGP